MIVEYIDDHRERFGVDPICRVLTEHGMAFAPSTYYARKKVGAVSEAVLAEAYAANAIWVHWYNTERLHSSIGHTAPIEHEKRYRQNVPSTPEVA